MVIVIICSVIYVFCASRYLRGESILKFKFLEKRKIRNQLEKTTDNRILIDLGVSESLGKYE